MKGETTQGRVEAADRLTLRIATAENRKLSSVTYLHRGFDEEVESRNGRGKSVSDCLFVDRSKRLKVIRTTGELTTGPKEYKDIGVTNRVIKKKPTSFSPAGNVEPKLKTDSPSIKTRGAKRNAVDPVGTGSQYWRRKLQLESEETEETEEISCETLRSESEDIASSISGGEIEDTMPPYNRDQNTDESGGVKRNYGEQMIEEESSSSKDEEASSGFVSILDASEDAGEM
ncbi:hypothetical protein R1sor_027496 [Riccia sorocarpa]|uniref:Uncharacterized protein n=1 Tax=Riccia sorocarpa TaxID=122646 RepID=A0ABD3GED5_9MARC